MAIYQPKYRELVKDPKTGKMVWTGKLLSTDTWWYNFTFAGRRIRESAKTNLKTLAREAENNRRRELERAFVGAPMEKRERRVLSVRDVTGPYLEQYKVNHRPGSTPYCKSVLKQIESRLGSLLLPDLTEGRVVEYMKARREDGAAGRTINAELGELSRAIGTPWKLLWPRVRRMEERRDVGQALSPEQEQSLIDAADRIAAGQTKQTIKRHGKEYEQTYGRRAEMLPVLIRLALCTGMRLEELTSLQWRQVDLEGKTITVGKSKTAAGTGRMIPMGASVLMTTFQHLSWWTGKFGEAHPDLYCFPFGNPPSDPKRHITTLKHSWETVRDEAGIECRWHDLRHSFCTKLAEEGVPESTMLALMGHMSRAMLERYSHIRMAAKRVAVEGLTVGTRDRNSKPVVKESTKEMERATLQ